MSKAPTAFRSISEAAEAVGIPSHTLRFWETQFPFLQPVKRPDGRRYYRPADVSLLAELKRHLRGDGRSVADVRRLHREGLLSDHAVGAPKTGDAAQRLARLAQALRDLEVARNRLGGLLNPGRSAAV